MTNSVLNWDLAPGTQIERKALQERFGGRTQGGIGPSRKTPNVLIFSDPVSGEQHGYFDGWRADGCFHYTGEGQRGDQEMKSGNRSILRHVEEGRALRVFLGARGVVTYEGEFELDAELPWYETDAPETNDGPIRSVIVFRMRPLDIEPKPPASKLDSAVAEVVADVPIEQQWTERAFVAPKHEMHEAERREQKLVLDFAAYLTRQGHEVRRLKIVPPGEAKPIFSDLIDRTTNTLYEAKGTVERTSIRMALGQLADYRRFVDPPPRIAVLVPSAPREDLQALLRAEGVSVVWPDDGGFVDSSEEVVA